jgi:hypothetical protein
MKTLASIISATLIVMFGIHGMYTTILPEIVLNRGPAMMLEKIPPAASVSAVSLVKAVVITESEPLKRTVATVPRLLQPVSLERVMQ